MRWKLELQPTCSFCLAVIIFSINIHCPAVAKSSDKASDKRRQKLIFKMLETSPMDEATKVNDTRPGDKMSDLRLSGNELDLLPINRETPVGIISERGDEQPLVSGSDKRQLTLSMLGKFKNTWCKTQSFMQHVKEPGCIGIQVLNRFCYGQCNSFYIPRTLRKRTRRKVFKSCGVCKPKRTNTIIVTLKCPGRKKGYKQKKIRQVKQCQCMER